MKNVCFFNSVNFWGGGEKLHLEYALEFRKKNYNVTVVTKNNSPLSEASKQNGLESLHISVGNLSFLNPLKIIKLIRFYKQQEIDTVIFSGSHDLKLGSIAAKLADVKRIVYLRGLAVPIKNDFVNYFIFKHILTHIVANSQETKKSILLNLSEYIDDEKVKTIYHGIKIESLDSDDNRKNDTIISKGRGVILGSAGRLTKQKGQHLLIEVAKNLKEKNIEFTLFIAGTGKLEAELKSLIKKYNLQQEVILLGFVKDMDAFMNSIDIFLLSSIWEGFGYVLVEAMIKSKPVIAFNVSSNPEIVTQNKTGFLINYPDTELFARKTQQLIQNEDIRKQLGENGKMTVRNRFNLSDRITEFEYYLLDKEYAYPFSYNVLNSNNIAISNRIAISL
jgi:glycosyltransferase involved in cell wall biosynthesis